MKYKTIILLALLCIAVVAALNIWWGVYSFSRSTAEIEVVKQEATEGDYLPPSTPAPLTESQIEQAKVDMNDIPPLSEEQVVDFEGRYQN